MGHTPNGLLSDVLCRWNNTDSPTQKFCLSNFARHFSVVILSPQVELRLVGERKMIQLVSFKIVYSCVKEESYKHHFYWDLLNSRYLLPSHNEIASCIITIEPFSQTLIHVIPCP